MNDRHVERVARVLLLFEDVDDILNSSSVPKDNRAQEVAMNARRDALEKFPEVYCLLEKV